MSLELEADKCINMTFEVGLADSKTKTAFHLNVNTKIPSKGITAIFGPSGSGKTTLLRLISGLTRHKSSQLFVNGDCWQDGDFFVPTHKRPIGVVFQEASLFPHLTVWRNLRFAIKRASTKENSKATQRILDVLAINHLLDQYPAQLSGGERQRVAIARALLIQPKLLLMDEPLASLDFKRKQEILPYLEKIHQSFDVPIIYVTHSFDEIARLSDHVLVLDNGCVQAQGKPEDVFSRIDLPFTYEQNAAAVIHGVIAERDNEWHLCKVRFSGGDLWVREDSVVASEDVRIQIKAKDVSLALTEQQDSSILNRIPAMISQIANDSDDAFSLVRLKCGDDFIVARITKRSVSELNLLPEMRIWAQIKSVALVS